MGGEGGGSFTALVLHLRLQAVRVSAAMFRESWPGPLAGRLLEQPGTSKQEHAQAAEAAQGVVSKTQFEGHLCGQLVPCARSQLAHLLCSSTSLFLQSLLSSL